MAIAGEFFFVFSDLCLLQPGPVMVYDRHTRRRRLQRNNVTVFVMIFITVFVELLPLTIATLWEKWLQHSS